MKKTILVLMLSVLGCNYGSSLADSPPGSGGAPGKGGASTSDTGGSAEASSGGSAGSAAGGAAGDASGGTSATASGGAAGAGLGGAPPASGGSTTSSSGGAAGSGVGGTTAAMGGSKGTVAGGAPGSGGRSTRGAGGSTTGAGGTVAGDAGTPGGSGGGSDASPADTRKVDGPPSGTGGSQGTGGTAGTGGATGAGGATTACVPAANGGPSGMNTGQACVSCHGSGQSPSMTLAGTVYSSATGGSAVSGATVTITGSNGTKVTMVTGSSGNFYSNSAISFPATVQVSKCPNTQTMTATISKGDCNSCHNSSMRIHLP